MDTYMHIAILSEDEEYAHVQVGNQDLLFRKDTTGAFKRKMFWLEEPMEYITEPTIHFTTNYYGVGAKVTFVQGGPRRQTLTMGNSVCFTLDYNWRRGILTLMRGASITF